MISDVLGIINLGEREEYIKELTEVRSIAALPFGGRYRMIDFTLSNMINSGIDWIGIVLKDKFHSLNDHIGPGKYWDLDRKTGGLRMLYPNIEPNPTNLSIGDLPVLRDNFNFVLRSSKQHVLLTRSSYLGNIDYNDAYEHHIATDSDITVLTRHIVRGRDRVDLLGLDLVMHNDGEISIGRNLGNQDEYDLSVEMYLFKKNIFVDIVTQAIESGNEAFLKRAIAERLKNYHVTTYQLDSDILPIHSLQSYYNASMQLLDPAYAEYLFYRHGKIYTKVKDAPSTMYLGKTNVNNSLIANGCIIEGTVENSILFRGVRIGKDAIVRNSIVFQDSVIDAGCNINNCVFDKNVVVGKHKVLMGDGGLPYVIKKGVVIK